MPLSLYLNDTAAMLNDQNFAFNSKFQLTRWVNQSRSDIAKLTGCIRRLITGQSAFGASAQPGQAIPGAMQPGALPGAFPLGISYPSAVNNSCQTIPGVERYPYVGFWNNYLTQFYPGCKAVSDSIALSVNWGGASRPSLYWMPWDNFQAYCRSIATLNSSYPAVWSVYNDGTMGEIWVFPPPVQANEMELDCTCLPSDLVTDDSLDLIPEGFREAVKYGAAKRAYESSQRYAQASVMDGDFMRALGLSQVSRDRGKSPSYYSFG